MNRRTLVANGLSNRRPANLRRASSARQWGNKFARLVAKRSIILGFKEFHSGQARLIAAHPFCGVSATGVSARPVSNHDVRLSTTSWPMALRVWTEAEPT